MVKKGGWGRGSRVQELCEQGGGPGLSFPIPFSPIDNINKPYILVDVKHHERGRWDTKYPCVCRRTKLPGRGVHSEKVREIVRR